MECTDRSTFHRKGKWYTLSTMTTKKTAEQNIYKSKRMGTPIFIVGILISGLVIVAGAIFVGKSDTGEIDVTALIQNSNQANRDANGDASKNVETVPDVFKDMPNGGLVPQEGGNTESSPQNNLDPAEGENANETATTTEAVQAVEGTQASQPETANNTAEEAQTDTQGNEAVTQ